MRYIFIITSIFIVGCGSTQKITSYTDRYWGSSVDQIEGNCIQSIYTFEVNPQRTINRDNDTTYCLIIRLIGPKWYFIPRGVTLFMAIDGNNISVSGEGSVDDRVVLYHEVKEEYASYKVTKEIMRDIANASHVEVRVAGDRASAIGAFTEENFKYMRIFCRDFCP